ncbi:MAG: 2-methylisocitrate lyase [Rhizobiales bacterium 62-47]|nr:isocitrate lyase/phosphoenolpyruvate mutase family protein [Hyphomicrobiales bacterium]OJY10470.1 MAG: 2-methylisocitrate lyase [Rhizobiales bacterium 62-47]
MPVSVAEKRATFHRLHQSGCFVIPNPWDAGSARMLQHLGFKALASSSAGFAWTTGHADNKVTCDDVIAHLTELCAAVDLPVNADFEGGFADEPTQVAANVTRAVATGIAGVSIEDSTGDKAQPLYEARLAVERIRASRAAIDASGADVMLVGRCESFFVGQPDLNLVLDRLVAYADAGADCLYAPGIRTREQVTAVVKAVHPKPVNLLIGWAGGMTVAEAADLGARRISIGGALARVAWAGAIRAAKEIAEQGSFAAFAEGYPAAELNKMFSQDS